MQNIQSVVLSLCNSSVPSSKSYQQFSEMNAIIISYSRVSMYSICEIQSIRSSCSFTLCSSMLQEKTHVPLWGNGEEMDVRVLVQQDKEKNNSDNESFNLIGSQSIQSFLISLGCLVLVWKASAPRLHLRVCFLNIISLHLD